MTLSKEQLEDVKNQLLKQLESWPESQREEAKAQIESLNDEELEEFLKKNNLIKAPGEEGAQQSPFRMIAEGKIPSINIGENEEAIAVLEINPISRGHTLVIPKQATSQDKISQKTQDLAEEVGKNLKLKLKPKKIEISITELFGEAVIQILPVYDNETFSSPRKKAEENDLKVLQEEILKKETEVIVEDKKEETKKVPLKKLPKAPVRRP